MLLMLDWLIEISINLNYLAKLSPYLCLWERMWARNRFSTRFQFMASHFNVIENMGVAAGFVFSLFRNVFNGMSVALDLSNF